MSDPQPPTSATVRREWPTTLALRLEQATDTPAAPDTFRATEERLVVAMVCRGTRMPDWRPNGPLVDAVSRRLPLAAHRYGTPDPVRVATVRCSMRARRYADTTRDPRPTRPTRPTTLTRPTP